MIHCVHRLLDVRSAQELDIFPTVLIGGVRDDRIDSLLIVAVSNLILFEIVAKKKKF